jgi:hypothetical protein
MGGVAVGVTNRVFTSVVRVLCPSKTEPAGNVKSKHADGKRRRLEQEGCSLDVAVEWCKVGCWS